MTERVFNINELVGKSVVDFWDETASFSDPAEKESFLRDLWLAANWNVEGVPGVIDDQTEALEVAKLLVRLPQEFRPTSVTSTDISTYQSMLAMRRFDAEDKVRRYLHQIEKDQDNIEIEWDGVTYLPGPDPMNQILNDALEAAGSPFRVMITSGSGKTPEYLFGEATEEEKYMIGGLSIRSIFMWQPEENNMSMTTALGVNDLSSTIMVNGENIQQVIQTRQQEPLTYTPYQEYVHRRIYSDFLIHTPLTEDDQKLFARLVLAHEKGHIEVDSEYGRIFTHFSDRMFAMGELGFFFFGEIIAELKTVLFIADMPEKTALERDKKMTAFRMWVVYRSADRKNMVFPFVESISSLLLSAARLEGNQVIVDWKLLRERALSLRTVLGNIIRDATQDVRFRFATHFVPESQWEDPDHLLLVDGIQRRKLEESVLDQLKKQGRDRVVPRPQLEALVLKNVITITTDVQRPAGLQAILAFLDRVATYERRVNTWMEQQLGLTGVALPFTGSSPLRDRLKDRLGSTRRDR